MLGTKRKNLFRNLGLKKSLRFFFVTFLLTTISLVFYYITPILFAWSGPSDLPPGGNIDLVGIVRNRFNMVEESVLGNVEIDLSEGSVFKHTLTGNVTYTGITGYSTDKLNSFKIIVEQDSVNLYEVTWPVNVIWKISENPMNLSLSGVGVYDFVTFDNGLSWYGNVHYDSRNVFLLSGDIGLGGGDRYIGTTTNSKLSFRTNNTDRVTITNSGDVGIGTASPTAKLHVASGNIIAPDQVFFEAKNCSATNNPGSWIVWETELSDTSNVYNSATGIFTAPVAGVYQFGFNSLMNSAGGGEFRYGFFKNGSTNNIIITQKAANTWQTIQGTWTTKLAVGNTVGVHYVSGTGANYTDCNYNRFWGRLEN